jgi:hypothetical protein
MSIRKETLKNFVALKPAKLRVRDEAPNLKTEGLTRYCLVWTIAHLRK